MSLAVELQRSTYADLTAAAIPGLGDRVFSRVPAQTALPYAEIGHDTILGNDDAGDFYDCTVEVSVFAATMAEMKTLAAHVEATLSRPPVLDSYSCHEWHFEGLRSVTQKYGSDLIEQGILEFQYMVQRRP